MSTRQAISFCLCCFSQVLRHLWSLHMSRIHCHTDLEFSSNVYPTNWFILSVLFLAGSETSVVLHMSRMPYYTDLRPGRKVYMTSWFILSVCFSQVVKHLWSLHMSRIPIIRTSTLVGMSTHQAISFCLCCF